MDIQKVFEQAKEHGPDAIKAVVEELKQQEAQAFREEAAACKAYFADVEERETKVKQRFADLSQQEAEIRRKITTMQPSLVTATVSGDTDTFNRIQAELADLEAQKAVVTTQAHLLSSAKLQGNAELYKAAEGKQDVRIEKMKRLQSDLKKVKAFVSEHMEAWAKIKTELGYIDFSTGLSTEVIKVWKHFENPRSLAEKEDHNE